MRNLDAAERLDNAHEVLLEERVVQRGKVVPDDRVVGELALVLLQERLKVVEAAVLVGSGDGLHRVNVRSGVPLRELARDDRGHVLGEAEHDLAQEHVLERGGRLGIVLAREAFERFEEVRVGRLVVLVLGVQHARLHVELRLQ